MDCRYDHFALLAEILPVGMPSLAINLHTITKGKFDTETLKSASTIMKCGGYNFNYQLDENISDCDFPGSTIYKLVGEYNTPRYVFLEILLTILQVQSIYFKQLSTRAYLAINHEVNGWLAVYNRRHNFSSSWRLREILQNLQPYYQQMDALTRDLRKELLTVFENVTVQEFIGQYIDPDVELLRNMMLDGRRMEKIPYFPRREFEIAKAVERNL